MVSNLLHLVTQWMSKVNVADGIAFNSSRSMANGRSTSPSMDRFHSPGEYFGTSPTCSTGKRSVKSAARESDQSSTDLAVDEPGRNPSRSTPCDFGRRNSYSVQSAHSRARYSAAPAG